MERINKVFANTLITIGILKLISLIIFGISQLTVINSQVLNITKSITAILQSTTMLLGIVPILMNISIKSKTTKGYILSYLALIIEKFIPSTTITIIAKYVFIGYLYISSGKSIKKNTTNEPIKLSKPIKVTSIIYMVSLILILFINISIYIIAYFNRNIEKIDSPHSILDPIQTSIEEEKIITIDNYKLDVEANYIITGLVTNTHHYNGFTEEDRITPLDVSIVWGQNTKNEITKKVNYSSIGDRKVYTRYNINLGFDPNKLSNNHLIPKNNKIKRQLKLISKGDYIRLEGFLVNIETNNGFMKTSTTRTDTGAGACEIIYVTKITYLKP